MVLDVSLAMEQREWAFERKVWRTKKFNRQTNGGPNANNGAADGAGDDYSFWPLHSWEPEKARTISSDIARGFQWFNAWNCRSDKESIFSKNPFSNKYLLGATVIVILFQMLAIYTPFLQGVLNTVPLNIDDWGVVLAVSASIVVVSEIRKIFARRKTL